MDSDQLTRTIIGAAIEVHRRLGPGLLESVYQHCLHAELEHHELQYRKEIAIPIRYRDRQLERGLRVDLIVAEQVIVEVKSVERILPVHRAQLLSYLRLTHLEVGLLINFNVPVLADGIVRQVNNLQQSRETDQRLQKPGTNNATTA